MGLPGEECITYHLCKPIPTPNEDATVANSGHRKPQNYLNSICLYAVTLGLIKVAILLEWLHIFAPKGTRNYFFWCAHLLLWVNALFYFAAVIVLNVSCTPRAKYWNRLLPGKCIDDIPLDIASAVLNFAVDVGILLLPQRVIWTLNMSPKNRVGVSAIFGLGILYVLPPLT